MKKYTNKQKILTFVSFDTNITRDYLNNLLSHNYKHINFICPIDRHCKMAEKMSKQIKSSIKIYCGHVLKNLKKVHNKSNIIFIDYGDPQNNKLFVEGKSLATIINNVIANVFIIKLARNYDFHKLINNIKNIVTFDIYSNYNEKYYFVAITNNI